MGYGVHDLHTYPRYFMGDDKARSLKANLDVIERKSQSLSETEARQSDRFAQPVIPAHIYIYIYQKF
jgi:hypothetical protein